MKTWNGECLKPLGRVRSVWASGWVQKWLSEHHGFDPPVELLATTVAVEFEIIPTARKEGPGILTRETRLAAVALCLSVLNYSQCRGSGLGYSFRSLCPLQLLLNTQKPGHEHWNTITRRPRSVSSTSLSSGKIAQRSNKMASTSSLFPKSCAKTFNWRT